MKAMIISGFGGADRLELAEVPTPEPEADEVLIRVTDAGHLENARSSAIGRAMLRNANVVELWMVEKSGVEEGRDAFLRCRKARSWWPGDPHCADQSSIWSGSDRAVLDESRGADCIRAECVKKGGTR